MSRDMGSTLLVRGQAPGQALPRTRPERINFLTHIINNMWNIIIIIIKIFDQNVIFMRKIQCVDYSLKNDRSL